jgi:hypothetical protein
MSSYKIIDHEYDVVVLGSGGSVFEASDNPTAALKPEPPEPSTTTSYS